MSKIISLVVFVLIEIILLPITIIGGILFIIYFLIDIRNVRTSITAYDPMFARWLLHVQGLRIDEASQKILYALPGMSKPLIYLVIGPTLLALRISGHRLSTYNYPIYSSSQVFNALGHRTRFFDDALKNHLDKVGQVVILGAGWDTRLDSIVRPVYPNMPMYEVDEIKTQTQKLKSIKKAQVDTSNIVFVAADFNKESWLDALLREGFDPTKPTFVLWEGVTYYLTDQAVASTLQTVAHQLGKGSVIAFDYFAKHIIDGKGGLLYHYTLATLRIAGEPWTFGIPTEAPAQEKLAEFLAQNDLQLAEYEVIGNLSKEEKPHGGLAVAIHQV